MGLACIVLVFDVILIYVEIPKMLQDKLYRELWVFSILLVSGAVLSILIGLNAVNTIPSDWISWVYSPVSKLLKSLIE